MTSSKPLKQISSYEGFMTLEDLQDLGNQDDGIHLTPETSRVRHSNHVRSNHHVVRHGPANEETYKAYLAGDRNLENVVSNASEDKVEGDVDAP